MKPAPRTIYTKARQILCGSALIAGFLALMSCTAGVQPILVTLAPGTAQAIDQGQSVKVTATVANDSQSKGVTWAMTGPGTLSGQTSTSATYNAPASGTGSAMVTATSVTDATKTASITITVSAPPAITTTTLPAGTVGTAYNQSIAVTGGAGTLTYSISSGSLPAGLSISGGAITGTPTTAGTSNFTVKVTDSSAGGAQSATQALSITVNQAPAITSGNSTTFTVSTAGTFTVTATGSPTPSLTETGALPSGVTFKDNGNGTGTLSGTPAAGTAQNYSITLTASNGIGTAATQSFTLTVAQGPAITSANSTKFVVGTAGTFSVTTTGFPAPAMTETGALPSGVSFKDNGNGTATLSGTPSAGTGGVYSITITAKNGAGSVPQTFTLTVDQTPAITSANTINFLASSLGTFTVTTSGYPTPAITESGALPTGVTFVDNGNGTGTLAGTATTPGNYPIAFTPNNGTGSPVAQSFTLVIGQAPAITSANNTTFTVGSAGTFSVTTSGFPAPALTESGSLPSGVTLTDNGNGTATLAGTPAAGTGGAYTLTISAKSSSGTGTQSFTLTVDQAPAITSVNSATFSVGGVGSFKVTTTGYPSAALSETGSLPSGVTFSDNHNGTAALSGTPASGSAGTYTITITASNGVGSNATQSFTLTVDTAPVITSANTTTFTVGVAGTFSVTTTGTPTAALSKTGNLPSGVTFTDNGNGSATIAGTPAAGAGGSYSITITASNGVGSNGTQAFTLNVDQAPAITSSNSTTFTVGTNSSFTVTTSGFPQPALTETGALPSGVTFADDGNGTATLSGNPASGSSGTYTITITASNGVGTPGTQTFTLTVNTAPVFTSATSTTFTAGTNGSFSITATGNPSPTISETGTLPNGVTFTGGTGSATLSGTPATGTGGVYNITIKATSTSGNTSQSFTLTVDEAAGFTSSNSATFAVGENQTFNINTSGYPSPATVTETGSLPSGVTFTGGTGPATLSGTPATGTAGTYPLTLTATNGIGTPATQSFTLTVVTDPCASAGTGGESLLNGSYAFVLKGFDNGQGTGETQPEPAIVGGVLTFNGSGGITAGTIDMNLNSTHGVSSNTVTSGTYKIGTSSSADKQRVCMAVTTAAGTQHYRVSINAAGTTGHMIGWDASGPYVTGDLRKQDTTAFSTSKVTGTYVFQIASPQNTASSAGEQQAAAGVIKLSTGNVTGGQLDFNDGGTLNGSSTATSWSSVAALALNSGTTYSISSNGRGSLTSSVTVNGTTITLTDVIYVVSSTDFLILTNFDQTQTGGLVGGGEALQRSGTMSNAILNGKSVLYFTSLQLNGGSTPPNSSTTIGVVSTNGSGTFTFNGWQNNGGSVTSQSVSGTYSVDSNGRVLLTGGGGGHEPLFYVVSTNEALFLGSSQSVEFGRFQPQTSTSASGTYAFGSVDPASSNSGTGDGVATFSAGNVTGTNDNNGSGNSGGPQTNPISGTFSVDSTGLVQVNANCGPASGTCQFIFYVISSTSGVGMDVSGSNPTVQPVDQ